MVFPHVDPRAFMGGIHCCGVPSSSSSWALPKTGGNMRGALPQDVGKYKLQVTACMDGLGLQTHPRFGLVLATLIFFDDP